MTRCVDGFHLYLNAGRQCRYAVNNAGNSTPPTTAKRLYSRLLSGVLNPSAHCCILVGYQGDTRNQERCRRPAINRRSCWVA